MLQNKLKIVITATVFLTLIAVPISASANTVQRTRQPGGTLRIGTTTEPTDVLNPSTCPTTNYPLYPFSTLIQWDEAGLWVGDLAESWSLAEDGLSATFVLKEGLKFSDGHPLTSADVAFSIKSAIETGLWSWLFPVLYEESTETSTGLALREGAVETPDDRTIICHYSERSSTAMLQIGGYYIYPKHIYEGHDISIETEFFYDNMVSSGMFVFKEYVPGSHMWLVRNENYHTPSYLDNFIWRWYSDWASAEIALINGEIDHIYGWPTQDWMTLSQQPQLELQLNPSWGVYYDHFNLEPKLADESDNPCVDIRVRKAVYHAIDIKAVLDATIGEGFYTQVSQTQPVFVNVNGYSAYNESIPVPLLPYDPDAARALLKDVGYDENNRLKLKYYIQTGIEYVLSRAQFFQSYCAEVGIDLEITALEPITFMQSKAFRPGPFEWHLVQHSSDCSPDAWVGPFQSLHEDMIGVWNVGVYNNTLVNQLITDGFTELDDESRANLYQRASGIAAAEFPILWLYNGKVPVAYNENFRGWRWTDHPMQGHGSGLYPICLTEVYYVPAQQVTTLTAVQTETAVQTVTAVAELSTVLAFVLTISAFVPLEVLHRRRKK